MIHRSRLKFCLVLCVTAVCFALRMVATHSGLSNWLLKSVTTSGNVWCTKLLINLGANVNVRDPSSGFTPLFYAAGNAHAEVIRVLLKAGADPSILDNRGEIALCWALRSGEKDSAEADALLMNAGGLPKNRFWFGCIIQSWKSSDHIRELLRHGIDPNEREVDGTTALMLFAENGDIPAVSTLLEGGAGINLVADDGRTALSEAVTSGELDTVRYLLGHGADSEARVGGRSMIELAQDKRSEFIRIGVPQAGVSEFNMIVTLLQGRARSAIAPLPPVN